MNVKKKLIALFFGANALALGGDAVTDNIPKIEAKDIPVAEEVVKIKEVDNVVEAEFSWKDATPIKVKYDLGEPTLAEKIKDKRDKEIYFATTTDGMDYGIVLYKVPDTNTFCFTVADADQYDWFKQPPLTQEELDEGAFRPENVVNSYAVYHKTLKNHQLGAENYATGKAFHRYRPQATDIEGNTLWGDSNFVDGQICDTFEMGWFGKAKYPVKI